MISLISSFEIFNAVMPDPIIFLSIGAYVADAAAVTPLVLKQFKRMLQMYLCIS